MKKAIYYPGLGGGIERGMYQIMRHFGYKVRQQNLDYYDIWNLDKGKSFMEREIEIAKDSDLIFGISFGGYVAYQVAKATGKKCILINPALDRKKTRTGIYDFDINYEPHKFPLNVYIATHDDVVPPIYTTEYLKKNEPDCKTFFIEDMSHGSSYEEIVQILKHSNV